ncbi:MAG: hypothetical protein ACREQ7_20215, partial [Candidatus Binatia bacterium]
MMDEVLSMLLDAQNADGGWGAVKGRRSNTESTSLAIMALGAVGDRNLASRMRHGMDWLIKRQNADGSWPLDDVVSGGSWTTAFAILALANLGQEQRALNGARWALAQEGRRFGWLTTFWIAVSGQGKNLHLNPDLKGWSWTEKA